MFCRLINWLDISSRKTIHSCARNKVWYHIPMIKWWDLHWLRISLVHSPVKLKSAETDLATGGASHTSERYYTLQLLQNISFFCVMVHVSCHVFYVMVVQHFVWCASCLHCISSFLVDLPQNKVGFFPFIKVFLHINEFLSSRIFSEFGSLSSNEAPGMLFSHRHKELLTQLVSFMLIICCPLYCIYLRS